MEASAALLVFPSMIRLSADRPGEWRRWGWRGYCRGIIWNNISCFDMPQLEASWSIKTFPFTVANIVFCLLVTLTHTNTFPPTHSLYFTPIILEVNARLSGWPQRLNLRTEVGITFLLMEQRVKKVKHAYTFRHTHTQAAFSLIRPVYPLLLLSSATPINRSSPAAAMTSYH